MDWSPILISMKTASLSIFITFFLGIFAAWAVVSMKNETWKLIWDGVLTLPLVLPPTVAGFFLLYMFGVKRPVGQFFIEYFSVKIAFSWTATVIAAVVMSFPLMYRSARGAFEQVDQNLVAAARTLGMSEWSIFWKVLMTGGLPGVVSGGVLAFARGLGEFGATAMIAGNIAGKTRTLPMAVYSEVAAGNMDTAYRYVAVIVVIAFLSIILMNWAALRPVNRKDERGTAVNSEYNLHLEVDIRKKLKDFSLDISFEAGRGCLGILGPSGCGKSMTLKSIAGIIRPDQGRIALRYAQGEAAGGRVLYDSALKINERPQVRRVGYLFQNYALFPGMTVEQNIMVGLKGGRGNAGLRRRRPMSGEARKQKVSEMVERFRLQGLEKRFPGQLSGGQQQRVALARSLAYEPEALLLDEPFSAMDTYLREGLRLELADALKDYDGVTIMVTHDRDEAYQLCDNLLLMDRGCVLAAGRTRDIFQNPVTCRAARLTGCKNISRIERLGERRIRAVDWDGLELATDRPVGDDITGVGIRAHDFEPLSESSARAYMEREDANLIKVCAPCISEMPFEWYITLQNGLWWKKEKDIHTHDTAGVVPRWLRVEPSALLLLTGEL